MRRAVATLVLAVAYSGCSQFKWPSNEAAKQSVVYGVSGVTPADSSIGVAVNTNIAVLFTKSIDPATLAYLPAAGACNAAHSLQLSSDDFVTCVGIASATFDAALNKLSITLAVVLAYSTPYKIRIGTGLKSSTGEVLAAVYTSAGFTTMAPPPFNVLSQVPADGATSVPVGSTIVINFSKQVNTGTATVNPANGACIGNVQVSSDGFTTCLGLTTGWDGLQMQLTLTPAAALTYNTVYQVKVLTAVLSTLAEPLASLYTSAGITTELPPPLSISGIIPADSTAGLALATTPQVTFSAAVNPGTVSYGGAGACTGSLQLSANGFATCLGIGSVTYGGGNTQLTINPSVALPPKTLIQVRLTTAVVSAGGAALGAVYTSLGFTTVGDVWVTKAPLPTITRGSGAIIAVNNQVYAIGGNATGSNEMYDPLTNTWTTKTALGFERTEFGIAAYNNKIYIIGGCGVGGCGGGGTNTVYEYDTLGNTWTNCGGTCTPMATARFALGATECAGFIYAAGGYNGAFYNVVERYNPSTNAWITRTPMANQREGVALASAGSKVYAMGGTWTADFVTYNYPASVEEYDPIANTWISLPATLSPGIKPTSVGTIAGKIFSAYGPDTIFREYDPVGNTFTSRASKTANLGSFGGAVANGKFYAINMATGEVGEYTPP